MFDIDYVFPYVNNNEEVWRKSFKDYCIKINRQDKLETINGQRYEDLGLLTTLVKCIKTNLSFIRKIHIIVSNIEQLPQEIIDDEKVNVVLHKDIIPEQYLPTFNSTTIEMFIPYIKDLAEHFIYGNDDMFPVGKLDYTSFFNEDGSKIRLGINRNKLKLLPNQFRKVCYNNNKLVIGCFNFANDLKEKEYWRPTHSITPMIKSHCLIVLDKCNDKILKHLNAFRTDKQHNQYIYPLYEKFNDNVEQPNARLCYVSCSNNLDEVCASIEDKNVDIICINDTSGQYRNELIKYKSYIYNSFVRRLSND